MSHGVPVARIVARTMARSFAAISCRAVSRFVIARSAGDSEPTSTNIATIGASGARILGTLVYELRRRGGGLGCAAICSGGGQGDAVIVEVNGS